MIFWIIFIVKVCQYQHQIDWLLLPVNILSKTNKHRTGKWWTISSGIVNYNKIRPDLRKSVAQPLYQSLTHQSSEARVEVSVLSSHYSMTSIAIFTLNIIITKKYICRIQEFRRLYLMATCWLSQTSKWIVWTYLYFEQKEEKGVSFARGGGFIFKHSFEIFSAQKTALD